MTRPRFALVFLRSTAVPVVLGLLTGVASAQDDRPEPLSRPAANAPAAIDEPQLVIPEDDSNAAERRNGRRLALTDKVRLAFRGTNNDGVSVAEIIPFIVETTGKVVIPVNITMLRAKKVTLVNDEFISRNEALDLLFQAFRLNGVGVIEKEDLIIIALITEMPEFDPPVIGPDKDIMSRTDRGTIVIKIFRVVNTQAENLAEQLRDPLPDHASIMVDANSNSIIVTGDIGLCQRLGELIQVLDHTYLKVATETFRLAHADAAEIAQNILELFEDTGQAPGSTSRTPARGQPDTRRMTAEQRRRFREAQQRARGGGGDTTAGPTAELRITVNAQQNTVTVSGEPSVIDKISELISTEWDLPRPEGTAKVYHLVYTDPIKIRDMLQDLLGGQGGGGARRTQRGAGARGATGTASTNLSATLGGIYQLQAYPDSNSLVVICKTEESFDFLDSLIEELDQPVFPGLPIVIELKHADAEEVADQINVMFAQAGARVDLPRRGRGLQGIDIEGRTAGTSGAGATGRDATAAGSISLPWQTARPGQDEALESALIGKVRVVPIHRQNAVMILAAPEYRDAIRNIIVNDLDMPGRQVMISAIIAEVQLTDDFALGIRLSNSGDILGGPLIDNRIGITGPGGSSAFTGTVDNVLDNLFDASILNVDVGLSAVLQALAQKTNLRILQEPRVFTSDNQEASFFEGQDVPILTSTQGSQGFVTQQIDYQEVGIGLNVRPRITAQGDVDMEINLEISNIVPGPGGLTAPTFGRRETTTQVIVKNGQTVVISGILRDQESRIERKVPLLGDIPLLGEIFKSHENTTTQTELIAFITPTVVDNPTENDTNYNARERQQLEQLTRPLREQLRDKASHRQGSRLRYRQYEQNQPHEATDTDEDE